MMRAMADVWSTTKKSVVASDALAVARSHYGLSHATEELVWRLRRRSVAAWPK